MTSRGKITSAENDPRLLERAFGHSLYRSRCGSSRNESFRVKVACSFSRKSFITQCNSTLRSWTNERTNGRRVAECFSLRKEYETSNLSSALPTVAYTRLTEASNEIDREGGYLLSGSWSESPNVTSVQGPANSCFICCIINVVPRILSDIVLFFFFFRFTDFSVRFVTYAAAVAEVWSQRNVINHHKSWFGRPR